MPHWVTCSQPGRGAGHHPTQAASASRWALALWTLEGLHPKSRSLFTPGSIQKPIETFSLFCFSVITHISGVAKFEPDLESGCLLSKQADALTFSRLSDWSGFIDNGFYLKETSTDSGTNILISWLLVIFFSKNRNAPSIFVQNSLTTFFTPWWGMIVGWRLPQTRNWFTWKCHYSFIQTHPLFLLILETNEQQTKSQRPWEQYKVEFSLACRQAVHPFQRT